MTLDHVLVLLFAVAWPLYAYFYDYPRLRRAVASGDPHARVRAYRSTMLEQWAFVAAVTALTVTQQRSAASLLLPPPTGWRLAVGVALVAAYAWLAWTQLRTVAAKPQLRERLRASLEPLKPLLPHTPRELAWFRPLALTAGICEEVLYRGYLVWVLTPWLGMYGAAGASVVVFGLAHSYQGFEYGKRAMMASVLMGGLALVTQSLLPGMVLHALIDLAGGSLAYAALSEGVTRAA